MRQLFIILVLVIAAIRICYELRSISWLEPYVPLIVAALLIYVPVWYASHRKERMTYLDRSIRQFGNSFKWFAITALFVLPSFSVANHFWQEFVFGRAWLPRMLPNLWVIIIDQLFLVAIPEEIFFRGWFQTRMNQCFAGRWNIFGVQLGWSWILTALIFATAHSVIYYQWWHFAIFFPALLFGWLRERTGTITASALWHCLGNITVYWIGMSYV